MGFGLGVGLELEVDWELGIEIWLFCAVGGGWAGGRGKRSGWSRRNAGRAGLGLARWRVWGGGEPGMAGVAGRPRGCRGVQKVWRPDEGIGAFAHAG